MVHYEVVNAGFNGVVLRMVINGGEVEVELTVRLVDNLVVLWEG